MPVDGLCRASDVEETFGRAAKLARLSEAQTYTKV